MRPLAATLIALCLLGQKELEPATPEEPERIRLLAIHGLDEGRTTTETDPSLSSVREFLDTLPYDTYREVAYQEITIPYGDEVSVRLGSIYSFHGRPVRLTDSGEVVLETHIDMKQADQVVEALRVTGRAKRGHGMVFRGLSMPVGEMIVVMSVAEIPQEGGGKAGSGESQESSSDSASGNSSSESSGESSGSGSGNTETSGDTPEPMPAEEDEEEEDPQPSLPPPGDGELLEEHDAPLPPELANLEGILRALEEVDRREQAASRTNRDTSKLRGAWW